MIRYVFVGIGAFILAINNTLIYSVFPFIIPLLNVAGGLIAVVPPTLIIFMRYKENQEIEQQFIIFINDVTESINTGMTLPLALEHSTKKEYGALTPHVQKMAAQVSWGIPFSKSLIMFSGRVRSMPVKRAVRTIVETYRLGGKISDTLEAVSESLITIDRIRKERSTSVHSQIVTSYLIFFVFIFILIILQAFLIPALSSPATAGLPGALGTGMGTNTSQMYTQSFVNFIIIQGFFAGLATGKMAEGSIVAGLKHSVLLIAVGYTLFSVIVQFQVKLF